MFLVNYGGNMIYIVTRGRYSDYHVIAATINRELAEKIKEKFDDDWDECRIEEFPDAEIMLKKIWRVYFKKNGEAYAREDSDNEYVYQRINDIQEFPHTHAYPNELCVIVEADSEEAAIKIAAEKRAMYFSIKNGL
jgi:hypothetical protein